MPAKFDNHEDKNKELEMEIQNRECFEGFLYSQDIVEKRDGYLEPIGSFTFCGRRLQQEMPNHKLTIIEAQNYKLKKCKECIYEASGKWPRDIIVKTHMVCNEKSNRDEKVPITSLSKEDIVAAIKNWIKNRCAGEVIAKRIIEEVDF